jgi:hypothetical protein
MKNELSVMKIFAARTAPLFVPSQRHDKPACQGV